MRRVLPTVALLALAALACGDDNNGPTGPVISTGSIEVFLTMTGDYLDPDGCQVSVDGGDLHVLDPEGSVTFTNLAPETHTVLLDDVAANCTLEGQNQRDVSVVAGQTVQMTYVVECTPCGVGWIGYEATDLGTLGGNQGYATDINDHGQVVGAGGLWEDGVVTPLDGLYTHGINNCGHVVGTTRTSGTDQAFLWEDGVTTDLGTLDASYPYSRAFDVNIHGQVVGHSSGEGVGWRPTLWTPIR